MLVQRPTWPFRSNLGSPQAQGLVGWWPLILAGQRVLDVSDHVAEGTLSGARYVVQPLFGSGLDFDGVDDSADLIGDTLYQFGTGDFTLALWLKSTTGGTVAALGKYSGSGDDYWLGFSGGTPTFSISGNTVSGGSANDGRPHLLVGTRLNGTSTLYVDGVPVGSAASSDSASPGGALTLGKFGTGAAFHFPGQILEVRVYRRGLSAMLVRALFDPRTRWELYLPRERKSYAVVVPQRVPKVQVYRPPFPAWAVNQ